ncbi:MAG: UDP-N-acetylmuramate dehydrogenase [Parvibaculales bacterium]
MTLKRLLEMMPELRGRLRENIPLSEITWFRVGGRAQFMYAPADADDLAYFLRTRPAELEVTILGAGSNVLIRDGGVSGVVVKLGKPFAGIEIDEAFCLTAGAAALDVAVARRAAEQALQGLEFYAGIPGTIGGALTMNAGAYGGETADCFISAQALTQNGDRVVLTKQDMGFGYRHNTLDRNLVFLSATYQLTSGDKRTIERKMKEISESRESSQPIRSRTGGSTFRNPGGADPEGPKAWKLIDAAGCRGLREGDAQVSEHHCNFLINHGAASASDLENLGETVRRRVRQTADIDLQWEIKRLGQALEDRS